MELKQKRYELHGHILVFTYNDAGVGMITLDCMDLLVDMAKNVPKHGEWEDIDNWWESNEEIHLFRCSVCGAEMNSPIEPNFCCSCGADMRKETVDYKRVVLT